MSGSQVDKVTGFEPAQRLSVIFLLFGAPPPEVKATFAHTFAVRCPLSSFNPARLSLTFTLPVVPALTVKLTEP